MAAAIEGAHALLCLTSRSALPPAQPQEQQQHDVYRASLHGAVASHAGRRSAGAACCGSSGWYDAGTHSHRLLTGALVCGFIATAYSMSVLCSAWGVPAAVILHDGTDMVHIAHLTSTPPARGMSVNVVRNARIAMTCCLFPQLNSGRRAQASGLGSDFT